MPLKLPLKLNFLPPATNNYIKATLTDHGGDTSKRWYISFWVWNVEKEELERKKFSRHINKSEDTPDKRILKAKVLIERGNP